MSDTITCWAPQNAYAETHPLQSDGARRPYLRCLSLLCGELGAQAPQTWTAFATNSIPTLAAGTQGTVKWIHALRLSHCLEVPLVAGSHVCFFQSDIDPSSLFSGFSIHQLRLL